MYTDTTTDAAGFAAAGEQAETATAGAVRRITIGLDGIVNLPAGTDAGAIVASGRDLVVALPDGTRLVIVDGAVFIPTLVIGTVEVPPPTLVALLIGHETQTGAGIPSSSGGNFAVAVGGLGEAFDRGDLLPPTALTFTTPTAEFLDTNVRVAAPDLLPSIVIVTPQTPAGAANAVAQVNESGLPARGAESPGSNAASTLETTTGTIQFGPGDGPAIVTVNGTAITGVGQAITTQFGVLTVTAARDGAYDYSYTLSDNTTGDVNDVLNVVVTDSGGDTAPGVLTIGIVDDVPTANADIDRVSAPTGPAATTATVGVDFGDAGFWSGVAAGSTQVALNGATLSSVNGALTFFRGASVLSPSDGAPNQAWTFEIDSVNDQPEALRVDFATAQTQVRLTLGLLVRENITSSTPDAEKATILIGLADGTTVTRTATATEMSAPGIVIVTLSASDFGGTLIRSVQLAPDPSPPFLPDTLSAADRAAYSQLVYSDFVLRGVSYDVPTGAGTTPFADGNVLTGIGGIDANATDGVADVRGADGASVTGVVAGVAAAAAVGNLGVAVAGTYGSLTLAADGSYRYVPTVGNAELRGLIPGETRTDTFTYAITDGDGDRSTTTLTITVDGSDDPVSIIGLNPAITGGDVIVSEMNLANGTMPSAAALTARGDFTVVAPDGYGTVTIAGQSVLAGGTFTATTITTPLGNTLSVTGFDPATGIVQYQYVLNGPNVSSTGGTDRVVESFTVVATDRNGTTTSSDLIATILDDAPIVNADIDRVLVGAAGTRSVADGNVLTGVGGTDANTTDGVADRPGADGGRVTGVGVQFETASGVVGRPVAGTFGTLTLAADGSYTYSLNNDLTRVQRLAVGASLVERFSYAVTDGDGDRAVTQLTITIQKPSAAALLVAGETAHTTDVSALSVASVERASERSIEAIATTSFTSAIVAAATVVAAAAPIVATTTVYQEHVAVGSAAPVASIDHATASPVAGSSTTAPVVAAATVAEAHPAPTADAQPAHVDTVDGSAARVATPTVDTHDAAATHNDAPPAPAVIAFIDASAIPVAVAAQAVASATPQADAHVATVLADALHGGAPAGAPVLDNLLAALPAAGGDAHAAPIAIVADVNADHGMAAAWSAMAAAAQSAAMTSSGHDGVTVLAHAA